jgi:hypothetical protein
LHIVSPAWFGVNLKQKRTCRVEKIGQQTLEAIKKEDEAKRGDQIRWHFAPHQNRTIRLRIVKWR